MYSVSGGCDFHFTLLYFTSLDVVFFLFLSFPYFSLFMFYILDSQDMF